MIDLDRLFWIGGAKGVGKSTISMELSRLTGISMVNTGQFFHEARTKYEAENHLVSYLLAHESMIVDTHYAGHYSDQYSSQFYRGMNRENLETLAKCKSIDLILIDLDPQTLVDRRKSDTSNLRDHDLARATYELSQNSLYFLDYCMQLSKAGIIIKNYDIEESLHGLIRLVSKC